MNRRITIATRRVQGSFQAAPIQLEIDNQNQVVMNVNLGFPWFTMSEAAIDEMVTGMFFVMFHNFFGIAVSADPEVVKLLESVLSQIKESVKAGQYMPDKCIKSWIDAFRNIKPNATGQDRQQADVAEETRISANWWSGPVVKPFSNEDRLDFDGNTAYPKNLNIGNISAAHLRSMPHVGIMPTDTADGVYTGPNLHAPQPLFNPPVSSMVPPSHPPIGSAWAPYEHNKLVRRYYTDMYAVDYFYNAVCSKTPDLLSLIPQYLFKLQSGYTVIYDPLCTRTVDLVMCHTADQPATRSCFGLIIGPLTASMPQYAINLPSPIMRGAPVQLDHATLSMLANLARYVQSGRSPLFWEQFDVKGVSVEYVNTIMSDILNGAPKMNGLIKDALPDLEMTAEQIKAVRKRLGMTQEKFAHASGLNIKTIRNWEQDKRGVDGAAKILLGLIDEYGQDILDKIAKLNLKD